MIKGEIDVLTPEQEKGYVLCLRIFTLSGYNMI